MASGDVYLDSTGNSVDSVLHSHDTAAGFAPNYDEKVTLTFSGPLTSSFGTDQNVTLEVVSFTLVFDATHNVGVPADFLDPTKTYTVLIKES